MKYAKGIMWLDDCRIPFVDEGDIKTQERAFSPNSSSHKGQVWNNHLGWESSSKGGANPTNQQGRFTPNLLVCDDMLNDGNITKVQDKLKDTTKQYKGGNFGGGSVSNNFYFGDKGTNSRYYDLDKWFDKMIDEIR